MSYMSLVSEARKIQRENQQLKFETIVLGLMKKNDIYRLEGGEIITEEVPTVIFSITEAESKQPASVLSTAEINV